MTQRLKGCIVMFENDVREDDAEALLNAIRCIKRVVKVEPLESGLDHEMAVERAKFELRKKLLDVLK